MATIDVTENIKDDQTTDILTYNGVPVVTANNYTINVTDISNLPAPVAGVITLPSAGKLYMFYNRVDLQGNTIRFGNNSFMAVSQELGGIDNAIVQITETCTISSFRFTNCEMIINAPLGAYDWDRVNFYDCPNCVDIQNADNCVFGTFGFINSENFKISGNIASLVLSPNCIFRSATNPTAVYFTIKSTAVVTRRIRIQDSVFQTQAAGQKSIVFEAGASVLDESFIFRTVRFTGAGVALTGINGDDDRADFTGCTGGNVINSTVIANMYMKNNAIPTDVLVQGDRYAMAGVTQVGTIIQKFVHELATNSLKYTSVNSKIVTIQSSASLTAASNNVIGVYLGICRNGNAIDPTTDRISESEVYVTMSGTRPDAVFVQCIATINDGDRIYIILQNTNAQSDITVQFANLIVTKAPV